MAARIPLIVEVFQHVDFRGKNSFIVEPIPRTRRIGLNDQISSLRVYRGPNFSNPNHKVILYEHPNFRGRKVAFGPGFYPNIHDSAYNFADRTSSINFGTMPIPVGPEWGTVPVIVECFENTGYRGKHITILRDIANLRDPQGGTWFEDRVSSLRITKGPNFPPHPMEVVFYEHPEYEGAKLAVSMNPSEFKKEIPNLHVLPQSFGDSISAIKIEGWASSDEFSHVAYFDEFIGNQMNSEWQWEDPHGGGSWSERQGYLEMKVEPGQDLWHGSPPGQGGNMDAPRLLMRASGDFAIETRIKVSPQLREHGGIIVWKSPWRFIRLEKTSGPHAFRGDVRFERHVQRVFQLVGRGAGLRNVREIYLRIERRGTRFSGFASDDGINWKSCGDTHVGMGDPVNVGLHALCPGNIPTTLTQFDYFRLLKRKGEMERYLGRRYTRTQRMSDEDRRRQRRDQRSRAMRELI